MENQHKPSVLNDIHRKLCILMWENIIKRHLEEIEQCRTWVLNDMVYKEEAINVVASEFPDCQNPRGGCYACAEVDAQKSYAQIGVGNCNLYCPVNWCALGSKEGGFGCCEKDSPFSGWFFAILPEEALDYAREVLAVIKKTWKTTDQFLTDRGLNPDVKAGY